MQIQSSKYFKIKVFKNHDDMSIAAAQEVVAQIKASPEMLLCPASGDTPVKTYEQMANICKREAIDTSKLRVIKLDEWEGISPTNKISCEYAIRTQVIDPLKITSYVNFGNEPDNEEQELEYVGNYLNDHGPIDLCILGVGLNGHLGFNEPNAQLHPFPHKIELSIITLKQHGIEGSIKPYGLTLGMANILQSKKIFLLINGKHKKNVMIRLLTNRIDTTFPVSFLLTHPDVTCFCDQAAMPGGSQ